MSLPIDVDQLSAVQAKKSANKGMSTLDHVLIVARPVNIGTPSPRCLSRWKTESDYVHPRWFAVRGVAVLPFHAGKVAPVASLVGGSEAFAASPFQGGGWLCIYHPCGGARHVNFGSTKLQAR